MTGPAAAGPIFGQLTRAKMPYELWWVVQLLLLKVATLEGTSDDSCRPQDFCWGWGKAHFVARRKSPSKRKFNLGNYAHNRSHAIEYACHYGGEDNRPYPRAIILRLRH